MQSDHILVSRRPHSNGDVVRHLGFLNRFFAYWRSIREVYSVIDRLHVTGFIQWVCDILVRGEIKKYGGFVKSMEGEAEPSLPYILQTRHISIDRLELTK